MCFIISTGEGALQGAESKRRAIARSSSAATTAIIIANNNVRIYTQQAA
jgi:hypothetical protein